MNRSDFLKMIESSGPADRIMISEVNELINIFPYFQSAYMLLLKGLRNTSDVKFENQLRISAMHIADREVLYYFLTKEPVPEIKPSLIPEPAVQSNDSSTDNQQTVIETAKNSYDLINEIEKISDEDSENKAFTDHSVMISYDSDNDESNATILSINEESGVVDERVTFMDPGFSVPEGNDLLELDMSENNHGDTDALLHQKEASENKPSAKQLQSDLIDKFIIANPRIEPSREKQGKPAGDFSKPFTEEREEFVTETLAKIYINQGYYSKALEIYEKLSLKFPEKSSYFASQIEKVKELIKR